ncbi:TlpA family protein disulfide reductase [candidate division KSB1 bacterium]|nr:TlpA family protein disulfide reductase [candidate division KSB1 bacterium]
MKRMVASGLVTACLLALLSVSAFADSRDWSLQEVKGGTFKLSENLGESPVLLVFWATWCEPCKKEIAEQRPLFDSYISKGVRVVLVSVDTQKTQAKVKPYVDSKKLPWPVALDPNSEVLKRYGGTSVPYTVLLDKHGDAKLKIKSAIKDSKNLTTQIDQLLEAE